MAVGRSVGWMLGLKAMHGLRKGNEGWSWLGMLCDDQFDWKKVLFVFDAHGCLSPCYKVHF